MWVFFSKSDPVFLPGISMLPKIGIHGLSIYRPCGLLWEAPFHSIETRPTQKAVFPIWKVILVQIFVCAQLRVPVTHSCCLDSCGARVLQRSRDTRPGNVSHPLAVCLYRHYGLYLWRFKSDRLLFCVCESCWLTVQEHNNKI